MVKSIIKEIIVILLLLLAITLALGVLFYDYIPSNKQVPSVVAYSTSESIQTELAEQVKDDDAVLVTYEITARDLTSYDKGGVYDKGKANPFAPYENNTPDGNSTNDKNNVTNTGNTNNGNTFYQNKGTK